MREGTKHRIKWDTRAGRIAREAATRIALVLMRMSRALLKWSLGRCSWCGSDCGFDSTVSKKGLRCQSLRRDCTERP